MFLLKQVGTDFNKYVSAMVYYTNKKKTKYSMNFAAYIFNAAPSHAWRALNSNVLNFGRGFQAARQVRLSDINLWASSAADVYYIGYYDGTGTVHAGCSFLFVGRGGETRPRGRKSRSRAFASLSSG